MTEREDDSGEQLNPAEEIDRRLGAVRKLLGTAVEEHTITANHLVTGLSLLISRKWVNELRARNVDPKIILEVLKTIDFYYNPSDTS